MAKEQPLMSLKARTSISIYSSTATAYFCLYVKYVVLKFGVSSDPAGNFLAGAIEEFAGDERVAVDQRPDAGD